MSGCRNMTLDVHNQLLDHFVGCERQYKLASDDDFESYHADAPKIPIFTPFSCVWIHIKLLVVIRQKGLLGVVDLLSVIG